MCNYVYLTYELFLADFDDEISGIDLSLIVLLES